MRSKKGFTLIELLVVISIIGILSALSIFGLSGARSSARDAKRRADLEQVRSGLEIYKADCSGYPLGSSFNVATATQLNGSCPTANTYISSVPRDPQTPTYNYLYASTTANAYELCAHLEGVSGAPVACGGSTTCGSSANTCNYKVTQP